MIYFCGCASHDEYNVLAWTFPQLVRCDLQASEAFRSCAFRFSFGTTSALGSPFGTTGALGTAEFGEGVVVSA